MDAKPLISIITPLYNQAPYIQQTILSVINQTYENWEWIILDDGSTDDTGEIIKKNSDTRIKYFFQEHSGIKNLTKTFNKALSLTNGSLVATLDGDDYWTEDKLETQIKAFNDPASVLCYSEARLVNKNNKKISYIGIPADFSIASNNPAGSALKELLVNRRCFIVNSTVIYRKDNLLKIGGFTEAKGIAQDYPTWIKLSLEGHFTPVYKCLGYYRKHPSSLTQNVDAEAWFEDETNFLQQFISENSKRLGILGIKYDKKILSEAWQKTKLYIPYN